MPWITPSRQTILGLSRSAIVSALQSLPGGLSLGALIPNSLARVFADSNGGMAYLCLLYLANLALQILPSTCTDPGFADRFGELWLKNYGGGRKQSQLASGTVLATGIFGTPIPALSTLAGGAGSNLQYQTTAAVTLGSGPTTIPVVSTAAGSAYNLDAGTALTWAPAIAGVNAAATVVSMTGGTDLETTPALLGRVIQRMQTQVMGGSAPDFVLWALAVSGVTRAWVSPGEMGPGTVTIRCMFDDLRASTGGFPQQSDVAAVQQAINQVRPICAIDYFVAAPVAELIGFTVSKLVCADDVLINGARQHSAGTLAGVNEAVAAMILEHGAPASWDAVHGQPLAPQTIYAAWVSDAVLNSPNVISFDLVMADHPMPANGSIAAPGSMLLT